MEVAAQPTPAAHAARPSGALTRVVRWLKPVDMSSPQTRVLDGLRALAALLVVLYHFVDASHGHITLFGRNADYLWVYGETGVHLFFILSGFLLFMPYVKAMRAGRPLPSLRTFYTRRALRILPAYFACLAILVAVQYPALLAQEGVTGLSGDVVSHLLMLHNLSFAFNRSINGPFWTLAIEWQFYLVLPFIAWAISLVVGPTRSTARIVYAVLGLIILALDARVLDGVIETAALPQLQQSHAHIASVIDFAMLLVTGIQGRFLEVFGTGMLCSVVYIVCIEQKPKWLTAQRATILTVFLLVFALVLSHSMAGYAQALGNTVLSPYYSSIDPTSWLQIGGSFLIGLGYAAFVLGVLFSGAWLHWVFEFVPLRYIGLWSYSLYMWHGPAIYGALPGTVNLTVPERLLVGVVISYLSYQLVERPFLQIRKRGEAPINPKAPPVAATAVEPVAAHT